MDMHCHLLWGVDDGAHILRDSLEIISRLKEKGFRGAYCTPHISSRYPSNTPARLKARFQQLLEALPENVPLTMDYAPVNELLEQKISQSREWLQQAFSGERDATLEEYSRLTEKKLTRRPPSRWGRLRKKGRKLLARAYHRIRRS